MHSHKREFLVQSESKLTIYSIHTTKQDPKPKIELLSTIEDFKTTEGMIHSGARFNKTDFLFLADESNVYVGNLKTNKFRVLKSKLTL